MAGQTELLLARARERFVVQDYYGAVHLLESVVDSGRAFADVHHLLGVSLSLLGQADRALGELGRALELNPQYVEALIHQGLVLNELGRTDEAQEAFGRAAEHLSKPMAGLPAPVAAQLANRHAELAETYAVAGAINRAIEQYQAALELGPEFHDLRFWRQGGRSRRVKCWRTWFALGPRSWMPRRRWDWLTTSQVMREAPGQCGRGAWLGVLRMPGSRPTLPCSPGQASEAEPA
jgi:tetratricopeptide (TPR) repeat protein